MIFIGIILIQSNNRLFSSYMFNNKVKYYLYKSLFDACSMSPYKSIVGAPIEAEK